ncbi:MAG: hypothetical protein AB1486_10500 [Planctomycetota bacterium]
MVWNNRVAADNGGRASRGDSGAFSHGKLAGREEGQELAKAAPAVVRRSGWCRAFRRLQELEQSGASFAFAQAGAERLIASAEQFLAETRGEVPMTKGDRSLGHDT